MIADVWTMKLDGSDKRRVTDFKSMSWAPFYHPSGNYFIFTSNKLGFENFELFIVDAKGEHEPVRVTFTPGFDGLPVFSPDGKKLCWTSGRTGDGKSQLFLADWNDEAARAALGAAPKRASKAIVVADAGITDPASAPRSREADLRKEVEWLADRETRRPDDRQPRARRPQRTGLRIIFARPACNRFAKITRCRSSSMPASACCRIRRGSKFRRRRKSAVARKARSGFSAARLSAKTAKRAAKSCSPDTAWLCPAKAAARYDSYAGLDVKDKIVLILRYVPEGVDRRGARSSIAMPDCATRRCSRASAARKRVLVVTGPNSPNAGRAASAQQRQHECGQRHHRGVDQRQDAPTRSSRRAEKR